MGPGDGVPQNLERADLITEFWKHLLGDDGPEPGCSQCYNAVYTKREHYETIAALCPTGRKLDEQGRNS